MNDATHRDWFGLEHFRPGARFLRDGARCYLLEEVASTNEFLLGRGRYAVGRYGQWNGWGWRANPLGQLPPVSTPALGTLVTARQQVAGRGRQGRSWIDCGGLQMSCVLAGSRADFDRGLSVWLGLMAVVALRRSYDLDLWLKWPNDLMVADRKLGGLLVESLQQGTEMQAVFGIGINIDTEIHGFPSELLGRATSLRLELHQPPPRPGEIAGCILREIYERIDQFRSEGWLPFRAARDECDRLRGREITLRRSLGGVSGWCAGIDDQGALVVQAKDGEQQRFRAGDVHLGAVASSAEETGS